MQDSHKLRVPFFFFFFSERETLLRAWALGARAGGLPAGKGGALSDFLLGAHVVRVAALLAAGDSAGVQVSRTLTADHLVTVMFLGQLVEGMLGDATSQGKHQVQGGLFLVDSLWSERV